MPATEPERAAAQAWGPPVGWYLPGWLAAGFALLALAVRGPNTFSLDISVSRWVQQWDGRTGELLATIGNALGYRNAALVLFAIAWVGLTLLRRRRDLWLVTIAAVLRGIAAQAKDVVDSPRPTARHVDVLGTFDSWGYPSGHVTTATVALGAVAWVLAGMFPLRLVHHALLAAWIVGVILAAWARIWHGAHWFTDTVGAVLLGTVIVLVAVNFSAYITRGPATVPPQ